MNNPSSPFSGQSDCRYDTLVVSQDRALFTQFNTFLSEFEPERKAVLANDLTTFAAMVQGLNHCDVMICDMRSKYSSAELDAYVMDSVPAETLAIGLTSEFECSPEALSRQQNLRFSGIIDNHKGWLSNWNQITAIRQAMHNPLMVSRIEEVPVSDVLQMISSGRWSVVVHIDGYGLPTVPTAPEQVHKGCISFYQGEPQTAWSLGGAGVPAMFDLLSVKKGILQVVKNVCAPTIRNIYLQTDEILLAHAVALDESIIPPAVTSSRAAAPTPAAFPAGVPVPTPSSDQQYEVKPALVQQTINWWSKNGSRLIDTIASASPQSFPVRWMSGDELKRIVRNQPHAAVLIIYGSENTISAVFSAFTRGFSSGKSTAENRFPVMRIGRSQEHCQNIAGSIHENDITVGSNVPALMFGYPGIDQGVLDRIRSRAHTAVFTVADAAIEKLGKEAFAPAENYSPLVQLQSCDMSWKQLTALLQSVLSTLMTIE